MSNYKDEEGINEKIREIQEIEKQKHYNDDYDSGEDLEQLIRVSVKTNSNSSSNTQLKDESLHGISDTMNKSNVGGKLKFDKVVDKSSVSLIRFLNCVSIILLLVTFFTTSISKMNNHNYNIILDYLMKEKLQAESNLLVLYIAFFIVTRK